MLLDKIENNYPVDLETILSQIKKFNSPVQSRIGNIEEYYNEIMTIAKNNKFKLEITMFLLLRMVYDSPYIAGLYDTSFYKDDKDRNNQKLTYCKDIYKNYSMLHGLMKTLLKAIVYVSKDEGSNLTKYIDDKLVANKGFMILAQKCFKNYKEIYKNIFEVVKSECFANEYINTIEDNICDKEYKGRKIDVLIIKDLDTFRKFIRLTFFNIVFVIFEIDKEQKNITMMERFKTFIAEHGMFFDLSEHNRSNLIKAIEKSAQNLLALIRDKKDELPLNYWNDYRISELGRHLMILSSKFNIKIK
eukprot:GAHX01002325.1.p1 GENE.GAHX01002325.1~~GAHX01002325.1.p1  ORF type:complete len:303 (+),score=41.97 GAHX01002325.1:522-1430(+)